jgi:hypothetical protein
VIYPTFNAAINFVKALMQSHSHSIHTEQWQSIDISRRPEAEMRELINIQFQVAMGGDGANLQQYAREINPNLPWADRHFELERVSGLPINPGETWKEWPYANSAEKFQAGGVFSHTYAERYWPKEAEPDNLYDMYTRVHQPRIGIRYKYGDLNDVIDLLVKQPYTRQAYLPVWFPEDTGVAHGQRVPCTLGYHFLMRANQFHVYYPIRSCDFVRHFRDDLYLTVRLQLWILDRLKTLNPEAWGKVHPGLFSFWCGSMHCFINDWRKMFRNEK